MLFQLPGAVLAAETVLANVCRCVYGRTVCPAASLPDGRSLNCTVDQLVVCGARAWSARPTRGAVYVVCDPGVTFITIFFTPKGSQQKLTASWLATRRFALSKARRASAVNEGCTPLRARLRRRRSAQSKRTVLPVRCEYARCALEEPHDSFFPPTHQTHGSMKAWNALYLHEEHCTCRRSAIGSCAL